MLDDPEERGFTTVKGDVVGVVEDAGIRELSEFGVYVAAPHDNGRSGGEFLDVAGHAERPIDIAGKGEGEANQIRRVGLDQLRCDIINLGIYECGFAAVKGGGNGVKRGGAGRQFLRVAGKLEVGIHAIVDGVGKVIQVKTGEMDGEIMRGKGAENLGEIVRIVVEPGKSGSLGDEFSGSDPECEGRVMAL